MPLNNFTADLKKQLDELYRTGTAKGAEQVVVKTQKASGNKGPRFFLKGFGDKEFIRMNSNSYLGRVSVKIC